MGKMSKQKGNRGELEASKEIARLFGVEARRGQQFAGGNDSPDIVADLPGVHLEVKRTECLRLWEALQQAQDDAGDKMPVVLHRSNKRPWVAIVRLEDLPAIVSRLYLVLMAKS